MDYCETNQGSRVRVLLTNDELQLPVIEELCNKYREWLAVSRDNGGGRKTRAANRRSDTLYEEIMNFKIPPIKLNHLSPVKTRSATTQPASLDTSTDSESGTSSTSSRPITRSLRPRSRTPSAPKIQQQPRQLTCPSTPANQRIRACLKQAASGGSSNANSSNVLSAALNQQHPSVSVTKIRQLLRADSAQKKRDEEKERQERMLLDRRAKEERAEAQKRQLLEERAITAKQKREQRLLHAAEVRKAREEARQQQKLKEQEAKRLQNLVQQPTEIKAPNVIPVVQTEPLMVEEKNPLPKKAKNDNQISDAKAQARKLNETFKKPSGSTPTDNIDISIQDETTEERTDKIPRTAAWARAPHLRDALIQQFSKTESQRHAEVVQIFPQVQLPVELEKIFGQSKAAGTKYLCRTSSAVWSPPHRSLKRTSSMVTTPNNDKN